MKTGVWGGELGGWEDFVYLDVCFEDNSFDAITLHQVIEHISDPIALLNECARILQPNGILLVGMGNTDSWTR